MSFIHAYFGAKIGAVGKLIELTKDVWDNRLWLAAVLIVLWTMFCIIGGIMLMPIDIIWCAIMWIRNPLAREVMEDVADEMMFN